MRRESSTVVVLVGAVTDGLLAGLDQVRNISVARAQPAEAAGSGHPADPRPGWESGALAMREAARRHSTYVIAAADPLAGVAAEWQRMWTPGAETSVADFETAAAEALAAWRDKRFELPDYYLVVAPAISGGPGLGMTGASGTGPDMYLGPLHAVRPRRVAVAAIADAPQQQLRIADTLRSLQHGPWWPPLGELLDAARRFYPGGLAESQLARQGTLVSSPRC